MEPAQSRLDEPLAKRVCAYALREADRVLERAEFLASGMNYVYVCHVVDTGEALVVRIGKKNAFWEPLDAKYRSEAAAMRYAREILADRARVPEVYSVGVEPESALSYLCMEWIEAQSVRKAVAEKRVASDEIAARIMDLVLYMASQPPPFAVIGGFDGSPLWFDGPALGPFASTAELAAALLRWSAERLQERRPSLSRQLEDCAVPSVMARQRRLVFRHGDLSVDNVLVDAEERLVLIDWEWAGVHDERDVWLELRELMEQLGARQLWKDRVPVPEPECEEYYDARELLMGVAWAESIPSEGEQEAELDYLADAIRSIQARP